MAQPKLPSIKRLNPNVNVDYIFNNDWVADLLKAIQVNDLLSLLVIRFLNPTKVGPFCYAFGGEERASDLVLELVQHNKLSSVKLTEAVRSGLILLVDEKQQQKHKLFKNLADSSKLTIADNLLHLVYHLEMSECADALISWIMVNKSYLHPGATYYEQKAMELALWGLAVLQSEHPDMLKFWEEILETSDKSFHQVIVYGLIIQNPLKVEELLPTLVAKNMPNLGTMLAQIWNSSSETKDIMDRSIQESLVIKCAWAGIALNSLLEVLKPAGRIELLEQYHLDMLAAGLITDTTSESIEEEEKESNLVSSER